MKFGEHHLLLATKPIARLSKALICLASGEPGKDNVIFAGRLLRHLGADATLLTVIPETTYPEMPTNRVERFLLGGQNSLARFGVYSDIRIRKGELIPAIQADIAGGDYDLIVLGAPLPNSLEELRFKGVIGSIISSIEDCSFLIIRSQQYQKLQTRQWRLK
jgi:nucleotide-binding universal stress UspA family protein